MTTGHGGRRIKQDGTVDDEVLSVVSDDDGGILAVSTDIICTEGAQAMLKVASEWMGSGRITRQDKGRSRQDHSTGSRQF